jgi:hypothetical protein
MSNISMLTLLIRASATLKNQDGDAAIHGYAEMEYSKITSDSPSDADFATLNCLSDILVQNHQVLAASYDNVTTFTLVTPSSNSESDSKLDSHHHQGNRDHDDPDSLDFPPDESVSSSTTLRSINITIIPNPDDRGEISRSSVFLGGIHKVVGGRSLWVAEDPLSSILEWVDLSRGPYYSRSLIVSPSINNSTTTGLADHAKSVSCYLYEYGRTRDKALRTKYSDSFFIYLLVASWKKVHAHFSFWQALGFIQALENGVIEDGLLDNIMEIGKGYGPLGKPGDDDIAHR